MNDQTQASAVRTTRGRSRIISQTIKSHSRRAGGPIQQMIIELVTENPDMPYADVAQAVIDKYNYARTSEKSVASTIYRAGIQ